MFLMAYNRLAQEFGRPTIGSKELAAAMRRLRIEDGKNGDGTKRGWKGITLRHEPTE